MSTRSLLEKIAGPLTLGALLEAQGQDRGCLNFIFLDNRIGRLNASRLGPQLFALVSTLFS